MPPEINRNAPQIAAAQLQLEQKGDGSPDLQKPQDQPAGTNELDQLRSEVERLEREENAIKAGDVRSGRYVIDHESFDDKSSNTE